MSTGVGSLTNFELSLTPLAFKYLTPKLRLDEDSLSEEQVMARSFHLVCSSERCISLVEGIMGRRKLLARNRNLRPYFVWEPVPDLCTPHEVEMLRKAIGYVDVVSPNAEELEAYFSADMPLRPQTELAALITGWGIGIGGDGVLVVREGAQGCTGYASSWTSHLPAFFQRSESSAVVDPTGGGNTFLGGLAMALAGPTRPSVNEVEKRLKLNLRCFKDDTLSCSRVVCAMLLATVAASYAIEQSGVPVLSSSGEEHDHWNAAALPDRVNTYIEREQGHIRANLKIIKKS